MGAQMDEGGEVMACERDGSKYMRRCGVTGHICVCCTACFAECEGLTPDPDPSRTARVRIAVGQRAGGSWFAKGGSGATEEQLKDGLRNFDRILWVELDLPEYEEVVMTAEVVG